MANPSTDSRPTTDGEADDYWRVDLCELGTNCPYHQEKK